MGKLRDLHANQPNFLSMYILAWTAKCHPKEINPLQLKQVESACKKPTECSWKNMQPCPHCEKYFLPMNLKAHMLASHGIITKKCTVLWYIVKNYLCDHCEMKFNQYTYIIPIETLYTNVDGKQKGMTPWN